MTRDEVMGMTNEEMRIKVGELRGWDRIRLVGLKGIPNGRPPGKPIGYESVLPNWPQYIAMAWELVDELETDHLIYVDLYNNACVSESMVSRWACELEPPVIERVFADTAQVAICRAFILAMTQEES